VLTSLANADEGSDARRSPSSLCQRQVLPPRRTWFTRRSTHPDQVWNGASRPTAPEDLSDELARAVERGRMRLRTGLPERRIRFQLVRDVDSRDLRVSQTVRREIEGVVVVLCFLRHDEPPHLLSLGGASYFDLRLRFYPTRAEGGLAQGLATPSCSIPRRQCHDGVLHRRAHSNAAL
jgi:hypothetical protein